MLTGEFNAQGVTRLLEAMRLVNPKIQFYQASSSEMFGKVREVPQTELTPFYPRSPYGVSKVFAPLHHGELPRELRPVRVLGHPLQPRVAPPRPRVRDPQGHRRRGPHQGRPHRRALSRQPRRQARLGLRGRLRAGDVADAAAGDSRTTTWWPPARATRCSGWSSWRSAHAGLDWTRARRSSTSASCGRPRSICSSATRRKARQVLGWQPEVAFEQLVGMMVDADIARHREHPGATRRLGSGRPAPCHPCRHDHERTRRPPRPPGAVSSPPRAVLDAITRVCDSQRCIMGEEVARPRARTRRLPRGDATPSACRRAPTRCSWR